MAGERFTSHYAGSGQGWYVVEHRPEGDASVEGPFSTKLAADAMAEWHNGRPVATPEPEVPFERKVVEVFEAVGGAVQSLALQADRYDAELASIRSLVLERTGQGTGHDPARLEAIETTVRAMSERLEALEAQLDDGDGHSVRA